MKTIFLNDNIKFQHDRISKRRTTIKLLLILLCIILLLLSGCRSAKIITKTEYKIDTVFVNKDIKTVEVVRDTLTKYDTIRVENEFSKVKVFTDSLNKIHVQLTGLPFKIPYQLTVRQTEIVRPEKKTDFKKLLKWCLISFLFGALIFNKRK